MDLTRSLKPVLLADVERRLNEPPPTAVSEFLSEPYALDQEQIEHYRERGFVKLEQVISGEALRYFREVIGYAVGHYFVDDDRAPGGQAGVRAQLPAAFNLVPIYPAIQPFAHAFRFADLCAQPLMGIGGVRLWSDQALYKQPGGRLTDYHKDAAFWPVQPAVHTTTIWAALDDVPRERGCMAFAAGSHRAADAPEFVDIFNVTEDLPLPGELGLAVGAARRRRLHVPLRLRLPPCRCQPHLRHTRGDDRRLHVRRRRLRLAGLELTGRAHARLRHRRPAPRRPTHQAEHPATGVGQDNRSAYYPMRLA